MTKEQVARINELARKKKTVGLTESEVQEQAELRAQYLKDFREGFRRKMRGRTGISGRSEHGSTDNDIDERVALS